MKKNISINISGIIFHIEEDGYDNLRKYLDSITKYFSSFEDSSEIMADIEGRIAEIFLSKLNEGKQVITAEDVTFLMTTMGSVTLKIHRRQTALRQTTVPLAPVSERLPHRDHSCAISAARSWEGCVPGWGTTLTLTHSGSGCCLPW
jgi:hypothetical protein